MGNFFGSGDGEFNSSAISGAWHKDSDLGFFRANEDWKNNRTNEFVQDASKLTLFPVLKDGWKGTLKDGRSGILVMPINPSDYSVHGKIILAQNSDGTVEIVPESYNFEQGADSGATRNFGTRVGHAMADPIGFVTGTGRDPETGFGISYDGQPSTLFVDFN